MIPIFVGGTGRSGTTILKRALLSYSEFVGFKSEMRIITDPDGVLDLIGALSDEWSPYKGDIAINRFRDLLGKTSTTSIVKRVLRRLFTAANISPPRYIALGLENELASGSLISAFEPALEELSFGISKGSWIGSPAWQYPPKMYETFHWPKSSSAPLLASAVRSVFAGLPGADKAVAFVEDTPFNILHAGSLFGLFPEMYLIHIYRDPRDVTASYLGKNWGGKDVLLTARRIRAILDRWTEVRKTLPADRVFEISLETLAASTSQTLLPIAEKLGVELKNLDELITVEQAHIGRWREIFSSEDLRAIEEVFSRKH